MVRHYLTMSVRSLTRHKGYALINLFGLVTGLSACLLLLLFVRYELGYDRWLPGGEAVHQLQLTLSSRDGEPVRLQMAPYPAASALARDFPEIEAAAGTMTARPVILDEGVATLPDRDALMADANFFDVVPLPFVAGDRAGALSAPNSVVLSEEEALKRFGSTDIVGATMTIVNRGNTRDVSVTGVFANLPRDSHLRFPMVFRLDPADYGDGLLGDWSNISGYVYARLRPGVSAERINPRLAAWALRHVPGLRERRRQSEDSAYLLVPAQAVHLGENQVAAMTPGSSLASLAGYGLIGLLILAVACFNFINLATARATQRAREIGVRKVLGATRRQLVVQFAIEALMVVLCAMLLALTLVEIVLPVVSRAIDADLQLHYFGRGGVWLEILALTAGVSVAGAFYPALHLSRFQPAKVLKANQRTFETTGSGRVRGVLAVLQFAVMIALTVCTAVIYAQTEYGRRLSTGYDRNGLLRIDNADREPIRTASDSLVREIAGLDGVVSVARASIAPGSGNVSTTQAWPMGRTDAVELGHYRVDANFFATMGTRLRAGRGLAAARALDDSSLPAEPDDAAQRRLAERGINVVVSARAARRLGFATPAAAVGRQVGLGIVDERNGRVPATIVGVVEDVRYRSLREEIEPIVYRLAPSEATYLVVRIASPEPAAVRDRIQALWQARAPTLPFEAVFAEDAVTRMYASDAARGRLFAWSSALAIAIGALGLFGLAAFLAERRTKEMALRKLFGARAPQLVRLLGWQLSRPAVFANLLAWPIAWWAMREWLNGFQERISLSPLYFIAAAALALLVAFATVIGQTLRVARARPINALRYE